jgi:hypothetical protein
MKINKKKFVSESIINVTILGTRKVSFEFLIGMTGTIFLSIGKIGTSDEIKVSLSDSMRTAIDFNLHRVLQGRFGLFCIDNNQRIVGESDLERVRSFRLVQLLHIVPN